MKVSWDFRLTACIYNIPDVHPAKKTTGTQVTQPRLKKMS